MSPAICLKLLKKIIGRLESIDLLDLDLCALDAKVDTEADSNALHCDNIQVDEKGNVYFELLDEVYASYHGKKIVMPIYRMKRVKSSNGRTQLRPSIKITADFFGKKYKTIITLTNRSDMKYPMLIVGAMEKVRWKRRL